MSLYNIPISQSFINSLADGIKKRFGDNVSKIIVYLPNKRAAKRLQEQFSGKKSPQIYALGDLSAHKFLLNDIPQEITRIQRLFLLANLIRKQNISEFSSSYLASLQFAQSAIDVIDEFQNKQVNSDKLDDIWVEDLPEHMMLNNQFLQIILQEFPKILGKENLIEPMAKRNLLLNRLAKYYTNNPPQNPVIIAGSTGTIPATSNLIKVIAKANNGYIITYGVDFDIDDAKYSQLEQYHPQYNLSQLLQTIDVRRNIINNWHGDNSTSLRRQYLQTIMQTGVELLNWRSYKVDFVEATNGIKLLECDSEVAEAQTIASIAQVNKDKKIIIVVNDEALLKLIEQFLDDYGLVYNNFIGQNIAHSPIFKFFINIYEALKDTDSTTNLLNLLKHNLCKFNNAPELSQLEQQVIRQINYNHGLQALADKNNWLKNIASNSRELLDLLNNQQVEFIDILNANLQLLEFFTDTEILAKQAEYEVFDDYITTLKNSAKHIGQINPINYIRILKNLCAGISYHPPEQDANISILPAIEARFENPDIIILADLNNGIMPEHPGKDFYFNRQIRKTLGLDLPERKTGQQAHDFMVLSSAEQVFYTRSKVKNNQPTEKSKFLTRYETILKANNCLNLLDYKIDNLTWVKPEPIKPLQPAPNPSIKERIEVSNMRLSVSDITSLMNNPYDYYVKKFLKLYPLDSIDRAPDNLEFGNIVHDLLALYNQEANTGLNWLLQQGGQKFNQYFFDNDKNNYWWRKFSDIAKWYVNIDDNRKKQGAKIYSEIWGDYNIKTKLGSFNIFARADRIELYPNNIVRIIDYKTGSAPSKQTVEQGTAPQLPIEALIAIKGGFNGLPKLKPEQLEYWQIQGLGQGNKVIKLNLDIDIEIAKAEQGIEMLINKFFIQQTPFYSAGGYSGYNNYYDLERRAEWG